ncbi:hypothetical protein NDU88_002616 [Pleurodeles waltl]|uniref:Uncharacterized protein n=1 Tax=Pleurodeles waltl TaxID=8319 RepID=A0AAV7QD68_PLEWA|nr:hypothetical protein NDU88_002616 [Pleurodeles waltl]
MLQTDPGVSPQERPTAISADAIVTQAGRVETRGFNNDLAAHLTQGAGERLGPTRSRMQWKHYLQLEGHTGSPLLPNQACP